VSAKVKVILNSGGGRLNSQGKIALIEKAMQTAGLPYHLEMTTIPFNGHELAYQAAIEGWPVVVAAGGDGTINGVLNGLMRAEHEHQVQTTLGIIPLGTANDLADMLGLPRDVLPACQRLITTKTRLIDVGVVNGYYFANNSAVGLEPVVTIEHERMRHVGGEVRYLLAALKAIIGAKRWTMRLVWDTGMYEGPLTLVSVGNSPRTGGSFYMTPKAKLDDGLLDFVYAFGMSRLQMLKLLPQTFKGKHIHHPLVSYRQTTSLSITAWPATPIQADGEVIDTAASEINYQIMPQKLRVIV